MPSAGSTLSASFPHGLGVNSKTAIMCPHPPFSVSLFVTAAPPGWLEGGDTPPAAVSPLLMDTVHDAGSCFAEEDMASKFQQI